MKRVFLFGIAMALPLFGSPAAGPFPKAQMGWSEVEKSRQRQAAQAILETLHQAVKAGGKNVDIPKGTYRFSDTMHPHQPTHIDISQARDLSIDGHGSMFIFEKQASAFRFIRCSGITLKNLTIDFDPLPFAQGTVVAMNDTPPRTFDFRPDPGYAMPELVLSNETAWRTRLSGHRRLLLWDRKTGLIKPNQHGMDIPSSADAVTQLPNGDYRVKTWVWWGRSLKEAGFEAGSAVTIWRRAGRIIRMELCEKMTMENITIYSGGFVAMVGHFGEGPITIRDCHLKVRPETNRLMSTNADGYNIRGTRKGATIVNCSAEAIGDDAINLHGVYYKVFKQLSPTELIVAKNLGIDDGQTVWHFVQGDPMSDPLRPNATNLKTWADLGKRTVINKTKMKYTFPKDRQDHKWAASANYKPGKEYDAFKVELDRPITVDENSLFWSENEVVRGSVIRGNKFRNILARGIRLQTVDCLIEDNQISYTTGPSLTLGGQPGFWGESTNSRNIVIRNNIFKDSGLFGGNAAVVLTVEGDPELADPIRDITFTGNQIINPRGSGLELSGCENILIKDNELSGLKAMPPKKSFHPNNLNDFSHYGEPIVVGKGVKGLTRENNTLKP